MIQSFGASDKMTAHSLVSSQTNRLVYKRLPKGRGKNDIYRLHDFYDYVRADFSHRLTTQSYRGHWNVIETMVESFVAEDELELQVLKTVGIRIF